MPDDVYEGEPEGPFHIIMRDLGKCLLRALVDQARNTLLRTSSSADSKRPVLQRCLKHLSVGMTEPSVPQSGTNSW